MRKSKEIKRMRDEAGVEYKRGKRAEGYKLWAEAKTELDALRGRNKPPVEAPAETPTAAATETPTETPPETSS